MSGVSKTLETWYCPLVRGWQQLEGLGQLGRWLELGRSLIIVLGWTQVLGVLWVLLLGGKEVLRILEPEQKKGPQKIRGSRSARRTSSKRSIRSNKRTTTTRISHRQDTSHWDPVLSFQSGTALTSPCRQDDTPGRSGSEQRTTSGALTFLSWTWISERGGNTTTWTKEMIMKNLWLCEFELLTIFALFTEETFWLVLVRTILPWGLHNKQNNFSETHMIHSLWV